MRLVFKGINITLIIGLVSIALFVAFIAFPQFGNQALIVRSGSMTPTIGVGDIVAVRSTGDYQRGDVIAFRSEKNSNTIITHRITGVESGPDGTFYKTKGDANEEEDNWSVARENVLGESFLTVPGAGKIMAFAKSDIGFPALIIGPAIFVILLEVISIIREVRKQKREKTEPDFGFRTTSFTETFAPQQVSKDRYHNLPGLRMLVPFVLVGLSFMQSTHALYADTEMSSENKFQAASDFTETTPTPTPSTSLTPTPTPDEEEPPVETGNIVINEVSSNGGSTLEWVELYNPTGSAIDVSGWTIEDNNSTDTLPTVAAIPAGGYGVIVGDAVISVPGTAIKIVLTGAIGNGLAENDRLIVRDGSNTLIDQMSYGTNISVLNPAVTTPGANQSMQRSPNGIDTDTALDWVLGAPSIGGAN